MKEYKKQRVLKSLKVCILPTINLNIERSFSHPGSLIVSQLFSYANLSILINIYVSVGVHLCIHSAAEMTLGDVNFIIQSRKVKKKKVFLHLALVEWFSWSSCRWDMLYCQCSCDPVHFFFLQEQEGVCRDKEIKTVLNAKYMCNAVDIYLMCSVMLYSGVL